MTPTPSHLALYWYLVVNLPTRKMARDFLPVLMAAVTEFKAARRTGAQRRRRATSAAKAGRFRVIHGRGEGRSGRPGGDDV